MHDHANHDVKPAMFNLGPKQHRWLWSLKARTPRAPLTTEAMESDSVRNCYCDLSLFRVISVPATTYETLKTIAKYLPVIGHAFWS
jgi:hypothetical protein